MFSKKLKLALLPLAIVLGFVFVGSLFIPEFADSEEKIYPNKNQICGGTQQSNGWNPDCTTFKSKTDCSGSTSWTPTSNMHCQAHEGYEKYDCRKFLTPFTSGAGDCTWSDNSCHNPSTTGTKDIDDCEDKIR